MARRLLALRSAWLASGVFAAGVLTVAACSETADPSVIFVTTEGPDGAPPVDAAASQPWGETACASCTRDRCLRDVTRCRSEPTCARHFECVQACPTGSNGEPDPTCAEACPPPSGSAAERAWSDFDHCRVGGPGATCQECPARSGRSHSPLLNQKCEGATWDAGPDASVDRENCQRCGAQKCCESRDRCRADPTCDELGDCQEKCSTPACVDECYARYDASVVGAWNEFVECHLVQCRSECGAPPDPCLDCSTTNCKSEHIECAANGDCALLFRCIGKCPGPEVCLDECMAKHPAGREQFSAWQTCLQAKCPQCL